MDGGRNMIRKGRRSRRRAEGTTAKIASMKKRGYVERSAPVEKAPFQDGDLEVDAVGHG